MNYNFPFIAIIYALAAGIIPALIWLFFWTQEDRSQEPKSLLVKVFLGGMLGTIVALFGEKLIATLISNPSIKYLFWAAFEEIVKLLVVAVIAFRSANFDEPVDAMIYCVTAALGFAALENTLFILSPFATGDFAEGIITGNLRFIGATLIHVISSGIIGFGVGYTYYKGWFSKTLSIVICTIVAIIVHTVFNLSIVNTIPNDAIKIFLWVWAAVVMLIVLFEEVKVVRPKVI